MKGKTGRKPLSNISNNNGARMSSKSKLVNLKNKHEMKSVTEKQSFNSDDDALDRLLLIQSDLSSMLRQIDELVVQAFQQKSVSKEGRKEIESFSHVLSGMVSSLKTWVPRFQKALSSPSLESESQLHQALKSKSVSPEDPDESNVCDSPAETTMDSLISPSPLVSWRANCTIQRGRQMFMLTPIPISKALTPKRQEPSKSEFNKCPLPSNVAGTSTFVTISKDMTDLLDSVVVKPTVTKPAPSDAIEANTQDGGLISSPLFTQKENSTLVMMTPCLKMSPPKSCVLLEPISEIHHGIEKVRKSTPFPVGIHYSDSEDSESPGREPSRGLALKYPELLGIQQSSKLGFGKKTVEDSPKWLISPPKTCVLMEPPDDDDKSAENESCVQMTEAVSERQINKLKGHFGGNLSHIESTPMLQEPESSFQTGKRPGENTLKKELWTKFEAASMYGLQPMSSPTVRKNTKKEWFLDLLEEASSDE